MRTRLNRALGGGALSLEIWLRRKRMVAVVTNFFSAAAFLVAASVILAATFFFTYAVIWFGFNFGVSAVSELVFGKHQHISHKAILIVCWCFLALLFIEYARVNRDYWTDCSVTRSRWSGLWMAGVLGSLVGLLLNASSSARMIIDLFLCGPRLLAACVRSLHRTFLLIRADIQIWSGAIRIVASRTSSVSTTVLDAHLQGQNSIKALTLLAALEIVLIIRKGPLTVVLNPDLRDQLRCLLDIGSTPECEHTSEPETVVSSPDRALYELLGVEPSASQDEIRAAFRKRMKQWHPDVFTARSDDARRMAEEKTKAIIAAYETLIANHHRNHEAELAT